MPAYSIVFGDLSRWRVTRPDSANLFHRQFGAGVPLPRLVRAVPMLVRMVFYATNPLEIIRSAIRAITVQVRDLLMKSVTLVAMKRERN
jgi:hypothetical protein